MKYIRSLVRRGFGRFGYDITRRTPRSNTHCQILRACETFGVDLILDVGANTGQFVSAIRTAGYQGNVVSFEPLSDAHKELQRRAANDDRWHVHERAAIGDFDGEIEINVSRNSVSSSVLPMLDAHSEAERRSAYVAVEKVPICTLNSVSSRYLKDAHRPFLKIDTQGFEWQVLDGAQEVLPRIVGVLCELSLVPLYEGQHLWKEVLGRLEGEGFSLWSIEKGFTDLRSGRTLQVDAMLFRDGLSKSRL